jgi:hypothetical protein
LADEVAVPLVFKIGVVANVVELSAGVPSVREKRRSLLNSVFPRVGSRSMSQLAIWMLTPTPGALTSASSATTNGILDDPVLATVGTANDSEATHAAGTPP